MSLIIKESSYNGPIWIQEGSMLQYMGSIVIDLKNIVAIGETRQIGEPGYGAVGAQFEVWLKFVSTPVKVDSKPIKYVLRSVNYPELPTETFDKTWVSKQYLIDEGINKFDKEVRYEFIKRWKEIL